MRSFRWFALVWLGLVFLSLPRECLAGVPEPICFVAVDEWNTGTGALTADGKQVYFNCWTLGPDFSRVLRRDISTGKDELLIESKTEACGQLVLLDGDRLLCMRVRERSSDANGEYKWSILLWDTTTRKEVRRLPGKVESFVGSADGSYFLAYTDDRPDDRKSPGIVSLWDGKTGKRIQQFDLKTNHTHSDCKMAFAPDGKTFAMIADRYVCVCESKSGEVLQTLQRKGGADYPTPEELYSLAFSPDGKTLAVGAEGYFYRYGIVFWDLESGKSYFSCHAKRRVPGYRVAYSPDGKQLFVGAYLGLEVWNLGKEERQTMLGAIKHRFAERMSFSADGRRVLLQMGEPGRTLQVWDIPPPPKAE